MDAWGGIAGVQSTLSILLDRGHHARAVPLERISELIAATPARRFRLDRKGSLTTGHDADLAIVDLERGHTLSSCELQQRHKISPYVGHTFRGTVRQTLRRGEVIFTDGHITARTTGRFVRPSRN